MFNIKLINDKFSARNLFTTVSFLLTNLFLVQRFSRWKSEFCPNSSRPTQLEEEPFNDWVRCGTRIYHATTITICFLLPSHNTLLPPPSLSPISPILCGVCGGWCVGGCFCAGMGVPVCVCVCVFDSDGKVCVHQTDQFTHRTYQPAMRVMLRHNIWYFSPWALNLNCAAQSHLQYSCSFFIFSKKIFRQSGLIYNCLVSFSKWIIGEGSRWVFMQSVSVHCSLALFCLPSVSLYSIRIYRQFQSPHNFEHWSGAEFEFWASKPSRLCVWGPMCDTRWHLMAGKANYRGANRCQWNFDGSLYIAGCGCDDVLDGERLGRIICVNVSFVIESLSVYGIAMSCSCSWEIESNWEKSLDFFFIIAYRINRIFSHVVKNNCQCYFNY